MKYYQRALIISSKDKGKGSLSVAKILNRIGWEHKYNNKY